MTSEVPKGFQGYNGSQRFIEVPGGLRGFQWFSEESRGSQRCSEAPRGSERLLEVPMGFHRFLRGFHRFPEAPRDVVNQCCKSS